MSFLIYFLVFCLAKWYLQWESTTNRWPSLHCSSWCSCFRSNECWWPRCNLADAGTHQIFNPPWLSHFLCFVIMPWLDLKLVYWADIYPWLCSNACAGLVVCFWWFLLAAPTNAGAMIAFCYSSYCLLCLMHTRRRLQPYMPESSCCISGVNSIRSSFKIFFSVHQGDWATYYGIWASNSGTDVCGR